MRGSSAANVCRFDGQFCISWRHTMRQSRSSSQYMRRTYILRGRDRLAGRAVLERRVDPSARYAADPEFSHQRQNSRSYRGPCLWFRCSRGQADRRRSLSSRGRALHRPADRACRRPSPTKPSSPSRTRGCSRRSRRASASCRNRSNTRPRPAKCSTSLVAHRPSFSRSWTRLLRQPHAYANLWTPQSGVLLAGRVRVVAQFGSPTNSSALPLTRGSVTGRAIVDRKTIHVHDLAAMVETEYPDVKERQQRVGHRTTLATPLLSQGEALGAISVRKNHVHPFSDRQIALLQTFADQAVIAIENARLFEEVQARTSELTNPSNTRRRRAKCSTSSAAHQSTSSRCSMPLPRPRRGSVTG